MWQTLTWWQKLQNARLAHEVESLRRETLWLLLIITGGSYTLWHIIRVPAEGAAVEVLAHSLRHWALFAIVMSGLGLSLWLQTRRAPLASGVFLSSGLLAIVAASLLLDSPTPLLLVPPLVLVAIVLLHPLAGLGIGAAALAVIAGLHLSGPLAFVPAATIGATALSTLLIATVGWSLGRILVTAVESSSASHAEAWRHAEEARQNRAELVQALKQLDQAYYRIQRANTSLELAWKAAEAAEHSKSEFVTNISHELRTPLNLVIGFSEMMLTAPESYQTPLPAAYRGDLHAIYRSAQHLLTLTNDVIDLARVGMDHLALVRAPVDVAEVIGDASAIVRDYIATKRLALQIVMAPELPPVPLDRLRIRQVLLNLLTNAARFTERGGIVITAERVAGGVRITVADTGRGIPADQLPRVFEEFYHDGGASGDEAAGLGGIGLGLPLSKRLVELHGGQIGVTSTVGVGTRFWFQLPLVAAPDASLVAGAHRPWRSGTAGGEQILIAAAPPPPLLEFLQRHLTGYQVLAAPSLAAARAMAGDLRALAILRGPSTAAADDEPAGPVPVITLPWPTAPDEGRGRGPVVGRLVKPITRSALQAALGLARPLARVLVVDDDRRFVRLLRRMLIGDAASAELQLEAVYDGQTALTTMQQSPPDLVLLDLTLPGLDGAGLLAEMAERPALAAIPVIIISAQDQLLAAFPLTGPLAVVKADGFRPEEILRVLDGLVTRLDPPRPRPIDPAVASERA